MDLSTPSSPQEIQTIDLSPYGAGPNSVAVSPIHGGLVAVAVEASPKTDPGSVVLFDRNGEQRAKVIPTGALPDMLTFTPDGRTLLVANEGEPNDLYTVDPEGSVTVIDFDRGLGNPKRPAPRASAASRSRARCGCSASTTRRVRRTSSPSTSPPTARPRGSRCRRTTRSACSNVSTARFSKVKGLGFKDHGGAGAGMDASDRDNGLAARRCPPRPPSSLDRIFARPGVQGMYQPDAIAAFRAGARHAARHRQRGRRPRLPAGQHPAEPSEGSVFSEEVRVGAIAGLGYTHRRPDMGNTGNAAARPPHGHQAVDRRRRRPDPGAGRRRSARRTPSAHGRCRCGTRTARSSATPVTSSSA